VLVYRKAVNQLDEDYAKAVAKYNERRPTSSPAQKAAADVKANLDEELAQAIADAALARADAIAQAQETLDDALAEATRRSGRTRSAPAIRRMKMVQRTEHPLADYQFNLVAHERTYVDGKASAYTRRPTPLLRTRASPRKTSTRPPTLLLTPRPQRQSAGQGQAFRQRNPGGKTPLPLIARQPSGRQVAPQERRR